MTDDARSADMAEDDPQPTAMAKPFKLFPDAEPDAEREAALHAAWVERILADPVISQVILEEAIRQVEDALQVHDPLLRAALRAYADQGRLPI